MPDLLLEILSEEIPARMQAQAAEDLKRLVLRRLAEAGLGEGETALTFATPRRLTLRVSDLPDYQPDLEREFRGPRIGAPEKAIEGFLRSRGLTSIDQCGVQRTAKGDFYVAVERVAGRPTAIIVKAAIEVVLNEFLWPKSMRWGSSLTRWVRPIQGLLCVFGDAVVPVTFAGREAGRATVGHRFLGPDRFTVAAFGDYVAKLREAKVMLDPAERGAVIADGAHAVAVREGLALVEDEALVAENAGLVEWPVLLMGRFDEAFMAVPHEVLTSAMKSHQRYFSVRDPKSGRLANRFVMVANMATADGGAAIVAGNERVLRARLADARFFWDQDRKRPLGDRVQDLDRIVFHGRLGTLGAKAARLERVAAELAQYVPGCDVTQARRAARLAKADLTTEMVGEFPDLQGVMGRYYARHDGEADAVAEAVAEHYAPAGPSDVCPTAPVSVAVALADKIDTLAGFFAIGDKPTGSKDPFALRRAALGVIRLVLENGLRLPLTDAFETALRGYGPAIAGDPAAVARDLLDVFADRLKVHLREQSVRHDAISAVFAKGDDDLVRVVARARALQAFLQGGDGGDLLTAYRRAGNIVRIETKRDGRGYDGHADPARFTAAEEKSLDRALATVAGRVDNALATEDFAGAMAAMAGLKAPVDAFFDRVTVNCDDTALRENRLRLLAQIQGTLDRVADFSKIEG
ncbi:MAG: glycine--tRNA ligase subunit beta [Alphaproteobacteria bacterium]